MAGLQTVRAFTDHSILSLYDVDMQILMHGGGDTSCLAHQIDIDHGAMKAVQFGAKLTRNAREHSNRNYTTRFLAPLLAAGPYLGSFGILRPGVPSLGPGPYDFPVPLVDRGQLFEVFNAAIARESGSLAAASDQCRPNFENSHNCDPQEGVETTTSAYAGTRGSVGRVELHPGLRYESTRIWNRCGSCRARTAAPCPARSHATSRSTTSCSPSTPNR